MHYSRMRTACFSGHLFGEGVSPWGCLLGGCLSRKGVSARGMSARGVCPGRGSATHPSVNRMADRCKNITFPQLHLQAVKTENHYKTIYGPGTVI